MEGNYLTAGDLALIENRRGWGYDGGCYGGHGYGHKNGMAATGIGLAAGLGGGALLLAVAGIWGINQASKARAKGAENANNLLAGHMAKLVDLSIAEKQSREAWQNIHAPSTTQYVDVRTGAGAFAGAGAGAGSYALAQAEANLLSGALTGQYARCPQEVTLVSKQNCGCPATNCGCMG